MSSGRVLSTLAATLLAAGTAHAAEGTVVWADDTCDYFIVQLPATNPEETFGLFASKTKQSIPKVGDVLEGDILETYETEITDKATGKKYSVIHWANAKSEQSMVRHSPVYCRSRYTKKKD